MPSDVERGALWRLKLDIEPQKRVCLGDHGFKHLPHPCDMMGKSFECRFPFFSLSTRARVYIQGSLRTGG